MRSQVLNRKNIKSKVRKNRKSNSRRNRHLKSMRGGSLFAGLDEELNRLGISSPKQGTPGGRALPYPVSNNPTHIVSKGQYPAYDPHTNLFKPRPRPLRPPPPPKKDKAKAKRDAELRRRKSICKNAERESTRLKNLLKKTTDQLYVTQIYGPYGTPAFNAAEWKFHNVTQPRIMHQLDLLLKKILDNCYDKSQASATAMPPPGPGVNLLGATAGVVTTPWTDSYIKSSVGRVGDSSGEGSSLFGGL